MSVYIDDFNAPHGRTIMCHMMADTREELDAMADKIGVARKWIQLEDGLPHYDVYLSHKKKALAHGAIECSARDLVKRFPALTYCSSCGKLSKDDVCALCIDMEKMYLQAKQNGLI